MNIKYDCHGKNNLWISWTYLAVARSPSIAKTWFLTKWTSTCQLVLVKAILYKVKFRVGQQKNWGWMSSTKYALSFALFSPAAVFKLIPGPCCFNNYFQPILSSIIFVIVEKIPTSIGRRIFFFTLIPRFWEELLGQCGKKPFYRVLRDHLPSGDTIYRIRVWLDTEYIFFFFFFKPIDFQKSQVHNIHSQRGIIR